MLWRVSVAMYTNRPCNVDVESYVSYVICVSITTKKHKAFALLSDYFLRKNFNLNNSTLLQPCF